MSFTRSDLAAECSTAAAGEGIRVRETEHGGCRIVSVRVCDEQAAERIGKAPGRYVTLECARMGEMEEHEAERVRCALAVELRDMAERMCGKRVGKGFSVLVAGLGNADITPDALGPLTVSHLTVTRRAHADLLPEVTGRCEMSALATGVSARTGLESAELLRGALQAVRPDLLVVVDALAARSTERLLCTVQLSDTGIVPGSGIGAHTAALTRGTLGVPVMALGVPTVVEASTLVYDTLARAGYSELSDELKLSLDRGRRFFVSPKEIDLAVSAASILLASSLEKAFSHEGMA